MGKGVEETLRDLRKHIAPLAPTFNIIGNFDEENVEDIVMKEVEQAQQPVEVE
jgi:hypothetical protein